MYSLFIHVEVEVNGQSEILAGIKRNKSEESDDHKHKISSIHSVCRIGADNDNTRHLLYGLVQLFCGCMRCSFDGMFMPRFYVYVIIPRRIYNSQRVYTPNSWWTYFFRFIRIVPEKSTQSSGESSAK